MTEPAPNRVDEITLTLALELLETAAEFVRWAADNAYSQRDRERAKAALETLRKGGACTCSFYDGDPEPEPSREHVIDELCPRHGIAAQKAARRRGLEA